MTTSLYGTSTTAGEVASTNFTTLYSNTTQSVPVQVSGNTTYEIASQATTGGANLLLTGSDGSTDTVKYQSGIGIVVSSVDNNTILITNTSPAGTTYNIDATAAIGGANLNLYGSDSTLDSVKFAGGTNVTVTRTDASTITISSAADDIPDGTVQGQLLYWDGTDWVAENRIEYDNNAGRLIFTNNVINGITAIALAKKYSGTLLDNTTVGQLMGVTDGSSNTWTSRLTSEYDTGANPKFRIQADPVGNFLPGSTTTYTQLYLDNNNLGINGNELVLLANVTGAPTQNAVIRVKRGTSTDATITWDETTDDRWELNNDLLATGLQGGNIQIAMGGSPDNEIYIGGSDLLLNTAGGANNIQSNSPIQTTAQSMSINSDATNADSFLYMKGSTESLRWNNTLNRFEFSEELFNSNNITEPAQFERRSTTAEIDGPFETKTALRLTSRITDAVSNATDQGGPNILFSRASGTTAGSTEVLYANIGARYFGTTNTTEFVLQWSNDNFSEPTPGNFPGTYNMLRAGSNDSSFTNNSLFIDYSAEGATSTATSITGGNTLVFPTAHNFTNGERIYYTSATQNGLTQNTYYYVLAAGLTATQCRIGLASTGSAIALTNGTGLTLNFRELINRVGVNMSNPQHTLDVNGDANVSGDIYISGVHVDLTTPVQQGQFLYVSDASPATITNSSIIEFNSTTYRPRFQAATGLYGRTQSGAVVSSNTGAVNYTTGDGASLLMGLQSDGQPTLNSIGSLSTSYNTSGDHQIRLSTSTNNFTSDQATSITGGNTLVFSTAHNFAIGDRLTYSSNTQNGLTYDTTYYVIATGFTTTQCQVSLTLGGSAVALTNGTGLSLWFFNGTSRLITATRATVDLFAPTIVLNAVNTGIAGVDAGLEVERGTSGPNTTFIWSEPNDRWEASTDFFVQQATIGYVDISRTADASTVQIDTNSGRTLTLDSDGGTVLINDNLNVDAGVLYVDAINNRVGVNTLNPTNALSVVGSADVSGSVAASEFSVDGVSTYNSQTTNTSSTSVVSISATTRASQKSIIRIVDNVTGAVHMLEALAFSQGSTAYLTTYAEMYSSAALATFTADVSAGLVRILATPASTNSTTFTVARISLD